MSHCTGIDTSRHGVRAIVVVHAELIRDACGYAVASMSDEGDRDLHAQRFSREDDASLGRYFETKEFVATSLDGLPGPPLPSMPARRSRRDDGRGHRAQPPPRGAERHTSGGVSPTDRPS
jgi:hypothetical protein